MIQLKVKKVGFDKTPESGDKHAAFARLPKYATAGAACFDISTLSYATLQPGEQRVFDTGLQFEVPEGYVMLVFSRSGHGFKNGVRLANGTGIIDSDYRGNLMVALRNDGSSELMINSGDRIAQAMIMPVPHVEIVEAAELSETERGAGGLGSTGTK